MLWHAGVCDNTAYLLPKPTKDQCPSPSRLCCRMPYMHDANECR